MHRKIVPGHPDPWIVPLSLQHYGEWERWGLHLLLLCVIRTWNCFVCLNILAFYLPSVEFISMAELGILSWS